MHFVPQLYRSKETIAAIATPPGEGGVAIVRISGESALEIANKIFSGNVLSFKSHTAHYGRLVDLHGNFVDQVLILVMLGKRSYTGEDTVEIHCHGGSAITHRVLETTLAAGARAALPGEFTFKAFINGKIDLAQAEAVQTLIGAKNEFALNAAREQLEGKLSRKVKEFQSELTSIAAILEAWVDFPEEGLEFASMEELCERLQKSSDEMEALLLRFDDGRMIHDGVSLCLVGTPNVGKSSLMNALLEKERAIVSPVAGTTRDLVEDHLRLNGLNIRLTDTAGIRSTAEIIEQEGIRRSRAALEASDVVLFVLDSSRGLTEEDRQLIAELPPQKSIAVWNKSDLSCSIAQPLPELPHAIAVSALMRTGIEELKTQINALIWKGGVPERDELLITQARHREALAQAWEYCDKVIEALKSGASPEFAALDMRCCLLSLGRIIGTDITEELLTSIFSTFCIGK